jgi:ribonucleoside-diphosphate reductase alpha chain
MDATFAANPGASSIDANAYAISTPALFAPTPNMPSETSTSSEMDDAIAIRLADGQMTKLRHADLLERIDALLQGLEHVSAERLVRQTLRGLYDGASESDLFGLMVQNAAALVPENPEWSHAAARVLDQEITAEVARQQILTFGDCIRAGHRFGLIADNVAMFVERHSEHLDAALITERRKLFGYFGLQTVRDRYLLRNPTSRAVIETPQYFFMRVACGLANSLDEAIEMYELMSSLEYLPSSPTLFNSGTRHSQMSSCYLLDSPGDELEAIYTRYMDIARLSKFSGGIGVAYHRVRSRGSLIRGTNGHSNGIIPWLKTLDSSVAAVNQGGRRKGACCVYLATWHADIEEFLELRDNTGDEARRTHNLNLSNWIPDLFMKRVVEDGVWSLFSPLKVPQFCDLFGERFEAAYEQAERDGLYERQVKAREMYGRMMRTLAQTGNGWVTFKDACNRHSNQTAVDGNVVHSSNLCTEIVEVTNDGETAVCNLGSLNLSRFVDAAELTVEGAPAFSFERLRERVSIAMKYLDRVIDLNYYPTPEARQSNMKWRPVGLGLMGLQDVFFKLGWAFDDPRAAQLSTRISEEIYFQALTTSCDLAERYGKHQSFADTRVARGQLAFDTWGVTPTDPTRWQRLRERIAVHGLRNSLMIAIAPTATIASISGCYECVEPMVSNLFKRETLSGDFLQINSYLVTELRELGLWTEDVRNQIKRGNGSVQNIEEIPADVRHRYRTAWELSQRTLIDMAAARSPFIDQSQSLNLFMETPTIGKVSSMYLHAWKQGLKTTYYLRSRPATRIAQTTSGQKVDKRNYTAEEVVACSLENPESCEACQ